MNFAEAFISNLQSLERYMSIKESKSLHTKITITDDI